jgi:coenzyme F420 biosynthesis associated uncharacterized protein
VPRRAAEPPCHDEPVIDWKLAERVAGFVAQDPPAAHTRLLDLGPVVVDSRERVLAYTGLELDGPVPSPETVNRREWAGVNLAGMKPILDPLTDRVTEQGPAGPAIRATAGLLVSAQVGALTGYMAQRVMGQLELSLLEPEKPGRLLFVAPNLAGAARSLDVDRDELTQWVAFHEVTHAVQFGAVDWLRPYLAGILGELLADVEVSVDTGALSKLPSLTDLRELVDAVRKDGLVALVARGRRKELVDAIQATMAVIEGYAEHVMDAVGEEVLPSLHKLRSALDRRRQGRSTPLRLLERLLGLEPQAPPVRGGQALLRCRGRGRGNRGAEPRLERSRRPSEPRRAARSRWLAHANAGSDCHKLSRFFVLL